jgi:hypothetical protein
VERDERARSSRGLRMLSRVSVIAVKYGAGALEDHVLLVAARRAVVNSRET